MTERDSRSTDVDESESWVPRALAILGAPPETYAQPVSDVVSGQASHEHVTEHAGTRSAVARATQVYLAGQSLDMSALATDLGIGRATLYRWVGSREQLLATVLGETTRGTFDEALRRVTGTETGAALVMETCATFIRFAIGAEPMKALALREPLLCMRLATASGAVEAAASACVGELLAQEESAGRLTLAAPATALGQAIVRVCDAHIYGNLIGGADPEIEGALLMIRLLLR